MSSKPTTRVLVIQELKRMTNSAYGNPRYMVTFTNGDQAQTQSDAAVNYGLTNPGYQGVPVRFTFTRAGRISHAEPAPDATPES